VLATTGGHPGQASELPFAVFLDELGLHVLLVPRLVDRDGHFRGVLVDFRDAGDFCRGVIRNALGGCFSGPFLLQLVPELLARDGDQAVDVTRLQVIERLVGRRLGIISAEQDDQQDDAADDDEGADTAEDPGQRALLGRFTAGETIGRWVAGWRALWRAVTTRPAPWWSVTAGLAVRRAVAWLLLRETAAGRLTLRVLGTRTLRAWWLGHLRPRLINATYGGGTEMSERQQRRERSGGAFHTKVAGTRAGPGHERGVCPPQFGRSGTSGRSGISGTLMSGISGMLTLGISGMAGPDPVSLPIVGMPARPQNFHSSSSLTNLNFACFCFSSWVAVKVASAVLSSTSLTSVTSALTPSGMPVEMSPPPSSLAFSSCPLNSSQVMDARPSRSPSFM